MASSKHSQDPSPSRVELVMTHVRQHIASQDTKSGVRLPSIRHAAQTLGVSKSTAVQAYERLVAEGEISSRRGAGFYALDRPQPLSLAPRGPPIEREIDPLWVMRNSVGNNDCALKPGCGWLPDSWMPDQGIRRALRAQARGPVNQLLNYSEALGYQPLRECFSRLFQSRGITAVSQQILLTDSGTQAIDLLCRLFLQPGDTVIVDDPCYFNFLNIARAHRAKIVSVPYTPSGPDVTVFAQVLADHSPRLYLTTGALQNPTSATATAIVQHRILKLAESHNLIVVEDDIFADFDTQKTTRLAAFDGFERVIYIGSCSKTVSASLRCGFIVARADWIESLVDLRLSTTFGGNEVAARVVHRLLVDGSYQRHMQATQARLAEAHAKTSLRIAKAGLRPWCEPRGGLFLWAELPNSLDAVDVTRKALQEGVMLAPGNVFSYSGAARSFLRFNVSQCAEATIFEVLERAIRVCGKGR